MRIRRHRQVGLAAAALIAASLAGTASHAGAAAGHVTPRIAFFPTAQIARRLQASAHPDATNMTYHGGAVMRQANNSVALFWLPPKLQDGRASKASANYVALIKRYFADIGGSPLNQVATQYYQTTSGSTQFIRNASHRVLAAVSTQKYPASGPGCSGAGTGANCVDDEQLRAFIKARIQSSHGSLPHDYSTEYYVFLAPHESSCTSSSQCFKADGTSTSNFTFCAYHSFFFVDSNENKPVIYANMPYGALAANGSGCTTEHQFPNDHDADVTISTTSHEQIESTTDPVIAGWYHQNTAGEIGDLCAYNYGNKSFDGGLANEKWNGHFYLVQQEWSNKHGGCRQGMS